MTRLGKLCGALILIILAGLFAMIRRPASADVPYTLYLPLVEYTYLSPTPTRTSTPTRTPTPTPTATPTLTPLPPDKPPAYTTSLYMRTTKSTTLYNLGCTQGKQDRDLSGSRESVVVLDYGSPTYASGIYGADMFGYGDASTSAIAAAVEQFGAGYAACTGADTASRLHIGVGTNNYGSAVSNSHGRAWAHMVNDINSWFSSSAILNRVDAAGASDMELSWNSPTLTRAWVDGYDAANHYPLYDYGDAAGCPTRVFPNWSCNAPWTKDDVWYIAYGVGPSYPLPLIYARDTGNAQQWYKLSLYGYTVHGARMDIKGAFTQYQACLQFPNGCGSGLDNTPAQGWQQLYNELNADTRTAQKLNWSTDIKWWGVSVGEAPLSIPEYLGGQSEIDRLEGALASNTLDSQARQSLEEKLAMARELAALQAQSARQPEAQTIKATPAPVEDPPFPVGIFEGDSGLFHSGGPLIRNRWQGVVDGSFVQIYAGSAAGDLDQGIVILAVTSFDRTETTYQNFSAQPGSGALRIVSEDGLKLELVADNGDVYYFDVNGQSLSR